jgi:SAM-dependent methyltransferase
MDEHRQLNLASWESRVGIHVKSKAYDVDALVAGTRRLSDVVAFDEPHLGDLNGLDVVHLQCHIGTDTLSLARLGARTVTGLDFSPTALDAARKIAAGAGHDISYVESELYDAVEALGPERFDLVYTGVGALGWLPDVTRWAQVVAALLRPGGRLYIREGHPMLWTLDETRDDELLVARYAYFETPEPMEFFSEETYTDGDEKVSAPITREWNHGLGEIVQAVIAAGLTVTRMAEHDFCEWQALPWMVERDRRYYLAEKPERLPLMYTLEARRA